MNSPLNPTDSNPLRVRRGRVASVDLYEVKDSELDLLEKGSPATIQLNFAVFLLSIAFSSVLTLCTATFKWPIIQTTFVVVAVIGALMGIYLLITWWKTRTSITAMIQMIRCRIDPQIVEKKEVENTVVPQPLSDDEPTG